MAVETEADIRAFFNADEHGETVDYFKDNAGPGVPLSALVFDGDVSSDFLSRAIVSDSLIVQIPVIDLPVIGEGDAFVVRGKRHYVKSQPPKIDGGAIWSIEFGG